MDNGIWIEEWAKSLGITEPVNGTWIQAIKEHYGSELENGTYIKGLSTHLGVTEEDMENNDILMGIGKKLGVSKHNGGMKGGFRKHFKDINDGNTPTPPVEPPAPPSGPTLKGELWESSVGTTNQSYFPAYGLYDYSTYGTIIKSSEIPADAELFNKLQFQVGGYNAGYTYNNMIIKMYHITTDSFVGTTYPDLRNQSVSDETTIWSGNLPITNGWNEITFDTNFEYNGTDGIVILFENRDGDWTSGYGWGETHSVSSNISIYKYNDYVYYLGSQYKSNYRLNIKLGY